MKERFVENAWWGFNIDYGLLHLQLATPVVVFILLLLVIFIMNRWLFQPVLRTLNNREKIVEDSKVQTATTSAEINNLRLEYEEQLRAARREVAEIYNLTRQEALKQRETLLLEVRQLGEEELKKGKILLNEELEVAKSQLQLLTHNLATATANRLLS